MIAVTRLNGDRLVINAELIKTIEQTPENEPLLVLPTGSLSG